MNRCIGEEDLYCTITNDTMSLKMNSSSYESVFREGEEKEEYGVEDDISYTSSAVEEDEIDNDDDSDDDDDVDVSSNNTKHHNSSSNNDDFKQHFVAIGVAIIAALVTHMHIHGGYVAWRGEMRKDWDILMKRGLAVKNIDTIIDKSNNNAAAPYAAPSMNYIPTRRRHQPKKVLKKAMEGYGGGGGGHERARSYRRTAGLSFCPTAHLITSSAAAADDSTSSSSSSTTNNLEDVEFLLALDPSVRVLHSYYLADALGVESALVYEDPSAQFLGTYGSDVILKDIDSLSGGDEVTLDQVKHVIETHLPSSSLVDNQHACLLHQYALNKATGRSIRGTTKVYIRPHVSTFYRSKFPSHSVAAVGKPAPKARPAPLIFTGFATKFINLSTRPVNLYWEGGRIPTGPKEGQMHTKLVGTVQSMESIGTASHPGHQFFVTTTYDKDNVLERYIATADEPVWYYDPLVDLSLEKRAEEMKKMTKHNKWTTKQRFGREAWMVNQSFSRDYLVKTRMTWLANFPQPYHDGSNTALEKVSNHMWPADYIGQVHTFETSHLYFTELPQQLETLTKQDYQPDMELQRRIAMEQFQSASLKGGTGDSNNNKPMSLNVKVVSCAPRVVEVKKFLSPVEVQHLINLASGMTGNVVMEQRVSASLPSTRGKRVRGDAMSEVRSSKEGWIHREQDVVVDTIFRRVADLLNIDEQLMRDHYPSDGFVDGEDLPPTHDRVVEAMQLFRYDPGNGYTAIHDFVFPSVGSRYQPRRFASVLLYLTGEGDVIEEGVRSPSSGANDDKALEGGETTFPRAITTEFHDGIKIKPQSGKAVMYYNVLPDGNMDDLSQHAGEKVEKGVKYLASIFVWDPIIS
ncbi:hypothetical protein ACHAXM_010160 [Skeletonema potamos]